jgi:hypothetical protein
LARSGKGPRFVFIALGEFEFSRPTNFETSAAIVDRIMIVGLDSFRCDFAGAGDPPAMAAGSAREQYWLRRRQSPGLDWPLS